MPLNIKELGAQGVDRFESYQQALKEGDVFKMSDGSPMWNVVGFEACQKVLKDNDSFLSSPLAVGLMMGMDPQADATFEALQGSLGSMAPFIQSMMVTSDNPKHKHLRTIVAKIFTPKMIDSLADQIRTFARDLLDKTLIKPNVDIMKELANVFPVAVIAHLLGVDNDRFDDFKRWTDAFVLEPTSMDPSKLESDNGKLDEFVEYFETIFEARRKNPKDDLIGRLVKLESSSDSLSAQELTSMCALLLVAGNETTTNWIGNTILAFSENYSQFELLKQKPELLEDALEETLRYYPPVNSLFRFAAKDMNFYGKEIKAGEVVIVWLAVGNRDARVFDDANQYKIQRSPNKHVAFGSGVHHCLGAPLARLEASIFFEEFLLRVSGFTLPNKNDIAFSESVMLFGMKTLPVKLEY